MARSLGIAADLSFPRSDHRLRAAEPVAVGRAAHNVADLRGVDALHARRHLRLHGWASGVRRLQAACNNPCSPACILVTVTHVELQDWDMSRISAAIPSGVGFLGGAVIWKGPAPGEQSHQQVHGLSTGVGIWVSSAVGILCGGGMYFAAIFGTSATIFVLHYFPSLTEHNHEHEDEKSAGRFGAPGRASSDWGQPVTDKLLNGDTGVARKKDSANAV